MNFHYSKCSPFLFAAICWMFICLPVFAASQYTKDKPLQEKLAELEVSAGGKIGVSAVNTANNQHLQYRAMERFPMGCTSKVVGVAAILKKSMSDPTLLQHKMHYKKEDLAAWSPITEKHVADGMTVSELCAAAITVSDNTAMNLLVKKLGGLQAINAYARSIGDKYFRVDNDWPKEAFSGGEGNLYDSSTPAAMEKSLTKLTLGDALARSQREQLLKWLKDNTTGETRIRAGVPKNWMVGDKTGTGASYGTTNDIAIIWPPGCAPLVVTIYFTKDKKDAVKQDEVVASATRLLLDEFSKTDSCIKQNVSKSV